MMTGDAGRINIVWHYFHTTNSENKWKAVDVFDISKEKNRHKFKNKNIHLSSDYSDPMYVLKGKKF